MGLFFLVKLGLCFYLFVINSWSWLPQFYAHVKVVLELSVTREGRFDLNVIFDLYHIEQISFSTDFFRPKSLYAPQLVTRSSVWKCTRPVKNKTTIPLPPGLPWAFDWSLALKVYGQESGGFGTDCRTYGRTVLSKPKFLWSIDIKTKLSYP